MGDNILHFFYFFLDDYNTLYKSGMCINLIIKVYIFLQHL